MMLIQLAAVPHQTLSVNVDNTIYDISIDQILAETTITNFAVTSISKVVMSASVSRANVPLVTSQRMVPGVPLLPYAYQETGNFILLASGSDSFFDAETKKTIVIPSGPAYADYQQFGITQFLYYASAAELQAIRAANAEALLNGA